MIAASTDPILFLMEGAAVPSVVSNLSVDALVTLVLALSLSVSSVVVALTPHPSTVQTQLLRTLLLLLGRWSFLRHGAKPGDSPGTLHLPGLAQPAPQGEPLAEIEDIATGPHPRGVGGPQLGLAVPMLALALSLTACLTAPIDAARIEYGKSLKVMTSLRTRFKAQSKAFQEKNIRAIGAHTPAAEQWQHEFVVRRQPVDDQIRRCDEVLQETSDLILLSDDRRGIASAKSASACVATLRDMVVKFFDGGQ